MPIIIDQNCGGIRWRAGVLMLAVTDTFRSVGNFPGYHPSTVHRAAGTVIMAGNHFGQSGGQNAVARVGIERLKYRMA
jgi:hypothetical protein